jgi:hypothetical protein
LKKTLALGDFIKVVGDVSAVDVRGVDSVERWMVRGSR